MERAILGGVNGLGQRYRLPSDGDALVTTLSDAVRAMPSLSRQLPDLRSSLRSALDDLRRRPVTLPIGGVPVLVGAAEVQTLIALRSGDLEFVKALPLSVGQMAEGQFTTVARGVQRFLREREWGTAMSYTMHLASGASAERRQQIERETPNALLGNAINYPFADPGFAASWGVTDLGDAFREEPRSDVPTLFLSGTLDGRTSVADAERVAKGFSRGVHVVIEGASHDPYTLDPSILATMQEFLRGNEPRQRRLAVPLQLRGPDEPRLLRELRETLLKRGAPAAAARLRELAAPTAGVHLTSYVPGSLAFVLLRDDKRPADARTILEAAVALYPREPFLQARLGEARLALGDKAGAAAAFARAIELDPFDRRSAVALRGLEPAK